MKILQVNNYHYYRGGAERVYLDTSHILEKKGHEVMFFSGLDSRTLKNRYSKYFVDVPRRVDTSFIRKIMGSISYFYSVEASRKLTELIEVEKPDLAHLHIFFGRISSSILAVLRKHDIPTVFSVHEYKMLCPVYLLVDSKGYICERCGNGTYIHCIVKKCNKSNLFYSLIAALECYFRDKVMPYDKYVDRFIMVSQFMMEKHLQYKPQLKNRTSLLYNYTNNCDFVFTKRRGDYYLYVGRLSKEKGLMTLLKAFKKLPQLKLVVVGDGDMKGDMERYIVENEMTNVKLAGFCDRDGIGRLMQDAGYIITPSECYETFGLVIGEAFSSGKPVIGANIGAIPELVKDGVTGYLFQSGNVDSLVKSILIAEEMTGQNYEEMSMECKKRADVLSDENKYYEELMKIYDIALTARR